MPQPRLGTGATEAGTSITFFLSGESSQEASLILDLRATTPAGSLTKPYAHASLYRLAAPPLGTAWIAPARKSLECTSVFVDLSRGSGE